MSVLLITEEDRVRIKAAIVIAKANATPWEAFKKLIDVASITSDTKLPYDEERSKLVDELYRKYPTQNFLLGQMRVAFNFEYQKEHLFRHMSVSLDKPGTSVPNPLAFGEIAKEFGFSNWPPTGVCRIWAEEYAPGRFAVNLVEMEEDQNVGHS